MQLPLAQPPDFAAVYRANHGFVWRALRHLGVDPARLDDAVQDTFLVVHRRLPEFAGRASLRTWLFEIARRIASRYRRSAAREAPRWCELAETEVAAPTGGSIEQAEAAAILQGFLSELDRDQAVVFVLTELEQWQAPEIAAELGVNLNTVYSRLRAARRELDRLVRRLDARDRRPRPRRAAQVLAALVVFDPPSPPPWYVPARAEDVLSDIFLKTCPIEPVSHTAGLAAAGSHTALGLSLAGAGLSALLVFGRPAPPPSPSQAAPAARAPSEAPAPRARDLPDLHVAAAPPPPAAAMDSAPARRATPARPRAHASGEAALAAELALVESIRAALLADDDRATLDGVARHRQRFPSGVFIEEATAAGIEARCRLGERAQARREAAAFAARWPASPLVARVDALCRS